MRNKYDKDDDLRQAWGETVEAPGRVLASSEPWSHDRNPWSCHGQETAPLRAAFDQPGPNANDPRSVHLHLEGKVEKPWEQQFLVQDLTIVRDRLYTLRFWYRGEHARPLSVELATAWPQPWKDLGVSTTIQTSTEWRRFEKSFLGRDNSREGARLCFNLGGHEGDLWLAGVSLQSGGRLLAVPADQSMAKGTIDIPTMKGGTPAAVADVKSFMRDTEIAFVRDMLEFLKQELGIRVPISSTQINYHMPDVAVETGIDYADLHSYWQHPLFPGRKWDPEIGFSGMNRWKPTPFSINGRGVPC